MDIFFVKYHKIGKNTIEGFVHLSITCMNKKIGNQLYMDMFT